MPQIGHQSVVHQIEQLLSRVDQCSVQNFHTLLEWYRCAISLQNTSDIFGMNQFHHMMLLGWIHMFPKLLGEKLLKITVEGKRVFKKKKEKEKELKKENIN